MAPSLSDISAQQRLLKAETAGSLRLLDEHAHPVAFLDTLDQRCWAHLRDASDGQVYVHELSGSRSLSEARYLDLLGVNV